MKIIYFHKRKSDMRPDEFQSCVGDCSFPRGGETIAIQALEPWFVDSLSAGDFFTKSVGKARCSDEDNYNKATGRDLAKSRMKPIVLTVVTNNDLGNNSRELTLTDNGNNLYRLTKNGNRVYFVGYY